MMVKAKIIGILCLLHCQDLLGNAGNLGLRARSPGSFGISKNSLILFSFLGFLILGLTMFFLTGSKRRKLTRRPSSGFFANNLYLEIKYRLITGAAFPTRGYLRELSENEAELVAPTCCAKNCKIELQLDSLPDFPHPEALLAGHVIVCRSLGGDPESFQLRLRFEKLDPKITQALQDYLICLSHPEMPLDSSA